MVSIVEQLVEIYFKHEWWHKTRMTYEEALEYHKNKMENGSIYVHAENGKVLGYYERSFVNDTCWLKNIYIDTEHRNGQVFLELYKQFFNTMPENIKYIVGENQQKGGRIDRVSIGGRNGFNKGI